MFSDNLKALRIRKGLSQQELAAQLHIVRQTVSKWEKGLSMPDAQMLVRLADIFGISVGALLGEASEASDDTHSHSLEQLNQRLDQLIADKNKRWRRAWKVMGIVLIALFIIILLLSA